MSIMDRVSNLPLTTHLHQLRSSARDSVPLAELDPRSAQYRPAELQNALIAVGGAVAVGVVGLLVGLLALFG